MQYYFLGIDWQQAGVIPQSKDIISGSNYRFDNPNAAGYGIDDKLSIVEMIPGVVLAHHAKITDYLDIIYLSSGWFIPISDRFKTQILNLKIPEHRWWPLPVVKRTKLMNYHVLACAHRLDDYVDFENSNFIYDCSRYPHLHRQTVRFKSLSEYKALVLQIDPNIMLRASEKFKLFHDRIEFDIFRLPKCSPSYQYVVSERFVEIVEKGKFTGMMFEPVERG